MTPLQDEVMSRIKGEHIAPVSPWYFRFFRGTGWTGLFISILLASLFTAFAFHVIFEIDWEAYSHVNISWYEGILMSVPFLWILMLALFLSLATYFGERTRHGYRFPIWSFLLGFFVVTATTGFFLENSSYDEPVERFFLGALSKHDSFNKFIPSAEKQWAQPENGLLGGEVMTVDQNNETLELRDSDEKEWSVKYEEASLESGVNLAPKSRVNVIGKEGEKDTFNAEIIRKPRQHASWDDSKKDSEVKGAETNDTSVEKDSEKDKRDHVDDSSQEVEHNDQGDFENENDN